MASVKLSVSVPEEQWAAVQALVAIRLGDQPGDSWTVQYALGNFLLTTSTLERVTIVDEMTRLQRERLEETVFELPSLEPIEF